MELKRYVLTNQYLILDTKGKFFYTDNDNNLYKDECVIGKVIATSDDWKELDKIRNKPIEWKERKVE